MNRRNISPQAVRICGLTLLCLAIMFGVAAANKAKGGEKLVSEYTVQDDVLPRHVKFESMPADMPQMTAAWFYKYKGLGQFDGLLLFQQSKFVPDLCDIFPDFRGRVIS